MNRRQILQCPCYRTVNRCNQFQLRFGKIGCDLRVGELAAQKSGMRCLGEIAFRCNPQGFPLYTQVEVQQIAVAAGRVNE